MRPNRMRVTVCRQYKYIRSHILSLLPSVECENEVRKCTAVAVAELPMRTGLGRDDRERMEREAIYNKNVECDGHTFVDHESVLLPEMNNLLLHGVVTRSLVVSLRWPQSSLKHYVF